MKLPHRILLLLFILLLTACGDPGTARTEPTLPPRTEATAATEAPTEAPTDAPAEAPTDAPAEAPTQPSHSELYIPGLSVEDVITYFNEVCLNAEIINSGDPTALQKWTGPIVYRIHGSPTDADVEKLEEFCLWLNRIGSFPGIWEAQDPADATLNIYFCEESEMIRRMGDAFYGNDGGVTFWYLEDEIYDAVICCRSDIHQSIRNSVILEELYNGLGPIQDTDLRPDSIIWSGFSTPQSLTPVDELLLKLLYHPDMKCGMDKAQCETVIRAIYY